MPHVNPGTEQPWAPRIEVEIQVVLLILSATALTNLAWVTNKPIRHQPSRSFLLQSPMNTSRAGVMPMRADQPSRQLPSAIRSRHRCLVHPCENPLHEVDDGP